LDHFETKGNRMNKREKQEKIDILVEAMEIYDREKQIQKQ